MSAEWLNAEQHMKCRKNLYPDGMTDAAHFNLSSYADKLIRERRKLPLAQAIRDAVQIRSIEVDLVLAKDSCEALAYSYDNEINQTNRHRNASETALLWHIILLYARATKTTSKARKQFEVRAKLDHDEQVVHDELCDLRDYAIAHYGHGGSYAGNWVREIAVAEINDQGGARVAILSRHQVVDRPLFGRARRAVDRALDIVNPVSTRRMSALLDALSADAQPDPQSAFAAIEAHRLNTRLFLGNEEQAAKMMAADGDARGGFHH